MWQLSYHLFGVYLHLITFYNRERSGSVVECFTRDRGVAGLSLTGVTALWSSCKTHLSKLSTGSHRKTRPCLTERLLMGRRVKSNKNLLQLKVNLSPVIRVILVLLSGSSQSNRKKALKSKERLHQKSGSSAAELFV